MALRNKQHLTSGSKNKWWRRLLCVPVIVVSVVCYIFGVCNPGIFAILLFLIACACVYFAKEKWTRLLFIGIFICCAFLYSPILLKIRFVSDYFTKYFSTLVYSDYKSSFIESIGGILGTFLAIIGALWTQHYFEQEQEQKQEEQFTTIVLYDLTFAFKEISEKWNDCHDGTVKNPKTKLDQYPDDKVRNHFKNYRILVDPKWITTVAKLPGCFDENEIELIYTLYGKICAINRACDTVESEPQKLKKELSDFLALKPDTLYKNQKKHTSRTETDLIFDKLHSNSRKTK